MESNIYPIIMISCPDGTAITDTFLQKQIITIGRGSQNDIVLKDEAQKISREHLRLEKRGDEIYMFDLNSRNGTLLNGKKIESEPLYVKLTTEDEVRLGEYILRVYASLATSEQHSPDEESANAETMEYHMESPNPCPSNPPLPMPSTPLPVAAKSEPPVILNSAMTPPPLPMSIKSEPPVILTSATARVRRERLSSLAIKTEESRKPDQRAILTMPRFFFVLLLAAGVGLYLGWWEKVYQRIQGRSLEPQKELSTGIGVTTLKIEMAGTGGNVVLQGSGNVTVRRKAEIKSPEDGQIEAILVRVNEEVKKGQVLIQLNQSKANVALKESEIEIEIAKREHKKTKSRLRQAEGQYERLKNTSPNLTSPQELEEARAQCDTLRATLEGDEKKIESARQKYEMAKIQLEQTYIRAPFDGVVHAKSCEVGEVAHKQGKPLLILVDLRGIGATIDINEVYLSKIFVEQEVELTFTALHNRKYKGKVREIMPAVDKQKATISVDVVFTNPDDLIRDGMTVKASFQEEAFVPQEDIFRILIPVAAVHKDGEHAYVWIVGEDSLAEKRAISVGRTFEGRVEVVNGLSQGDEVIVGSEGYLQVGTKVKKTG